MAGNSCAREWSAGCVDSICCYWAWTRPPNYCELVAHHPPNVRASHTACSPLSSYNDNNPMGALDVVADAADMAMDEGERNMTSWTKARQELVELRTRVAANTHAIEVRRSNDP